MGTKIHHLQERTVTTMNFNVNTLTETQKNALFAFGEKNKVGTGCNLMIAASMCEGHVVGIMLMCLADLVDTCGLTDEEYEQVLYNIRLETETNITNMEMDYLGMTGKKPGALPWRAFARKKILAAFGSESCGETVKRLSYVEHVTVHPELKKVVHDLTADIAQMSVYHPEKFPPLLEEARRTDELWRLKADDLGFFHITQ